MFTSAIIYLLSIILVGVFLYSTVIMILLYLEKLALAKKGSYKKNQQNEHGIFWENRKKGSH